MFRDGQTVTSTALGLLALVSAGTTLGSSACETELVAAGAGQKPGRDPGSSARFAALDTGQPGNSSTAENNAKLLRLLGDLPLDQRTARFRCVLALTPVPRPTGGMKAEECRMQTELFEGTCEGRIDVAPRGRCGFGYDPLFVPDGHERTFAELEAATKNELSHRGRAWAALAEWLRENAPA